MRKLRCLHRCGFVVLFAFSAFSQTLPTGVRKGASLEGITEYTFPNGLQVLLFPEATNPKITVNVTYLVGSRHEGYGETGMAHLLEHLLFIKTTNGREIKKELTGRGAQWNGSTNSDRTNYYETFTAAEENLRWALSLEADRMVKCILDKGLLDTEMTVVRNEFEMGENSPQRVLMQRVMSTAYLWHNYGKSTIGARADIENVPIDRLTAFYRKYYQPDNAVLVISGQIDETKALQLVSETVGSIPRPERKLDITYTTEPAQDGERYVALRRLGDGKAIMIAYHIPSAAHPDSAALSVLAGIMSGGGRGGAGTGSGRLYKALVENKKAVSAQMGARQQHDPGVASVSAVLSNDQSLPEARSIMINVVEGLVSEPPTKEEVDRAKSRLVRAAEMEMANPQSVGLGLSEWAAMGDWRLLFLNRDRVKAVTPEDVVRVARAYLIESNRTVGEFIPTGKVERAEVPNAPSFTELFRDYKGGAGMAQGEAFDPTPSNIESRIVRSRLANGMKVAMLPKKTRGGTVSAMVELHFGDETLLANKSAVAQMAGSLLMRGTKTRSRQQIQDEMDKLNARISVTGGGGGAAGGGRRGGGATATTGVADATASIDTTAANLIPAMRLAVEMLREPAFTDTDFEQARTQRIAAIESTRTDPQALAADTMQRHLSPFATTDARYPRTIDERIAELKKVTLDDVKRFHSQFYGASNGVLVVLGQYEAEPLMKAVAELFGSWKSPSAYKQLSTPFRKSAPANVKIETPDKQNALFQAGLRVHLSQDDPDYPALLIANSMFGGSLGARMPNRIRNVEGLSYSVGSRFTAPDAGDGALFSGSAISAPQNTPKVEASFKDELTRTLKGGFTNEELATAKKAYRDQLTVARSQEQGLLRTIAAREEAGRTLKWDQEMDAKIQSLTVEQVNTAFRRHLNPEALAIVKAGDFSKAGVYR